MAINALVTMVSSLALMLRHHRNCQTSVVAPIACCQAGVVALIMMASLLLMRRHLCCHCDCNCCPRDDGIIVIVDTQASLFRIPHKPPAGSLKVLHAPVRWGGIRRASQTKIYNLETDEFVSNPPFLKTNLAGVILYPTFWREQLELI
jgi:hypothetical protein